MMALQDTCRVHPRSFTFPSPQEAPQAPPSKETFAHVATLVANPTLPFLLVLFRFQGPSCITEGPSHLLTIETVPVWDVAGMYGHVLHVVEENCPTPSQGDPDLPRPLCLSHQPARQLSTSGPILEVEKLALLVCS